MNRHILTVVLLLLPAASASAEPPPPPEELTISFEERLVTALGATPNGKVAWFSVAREISEFAARIVKRQAIADADAAGETTFELDDPLPQQSIWVAVDVETGRFAVAADPRFELRELVLDPAALRPGAGDADVLAGDHDFLEVLLVRPGKGARTGGVWGGTVGDGGASDDDQTSNGTIVLPLSRLIRLANLHP